MYNFENFIKEFIIFYDVHIMDISVFFICLVGYSFVICTYFIIYRADYIFKDTYINQKTLNNENVCIEHNTK